ncbi:hypothetical protein JCM3765_002504 [Sporobolomyces pararoseus]
MLQRPRGLDHNQENPYAAGPSHHNSLNHKTPARPHGKGPAPVTGGKAAATSTIGRGILGRKDGNQGKGGGGPGKDSALLFPSKPSTSTAGPSQQQQQPFKTPAPKPRSLRPLADLQTPATALRPKRAPVLVPSPEVEREVEIDVEAEQEAKLQEMMDREVEYAGPSATDYEEPYEPECEVTDYKKANYGDILRAMSFNGIETYAEWEARDALERKEMEFPLEEPIKVDSDAEVEDDSQPLFPIPASSAPRRAPLATKTSNKALPSSVRSSATLTSTRKPLNPSASTLRRPGLPSSLSAPSTATRRALGVQPASSSSLSRSTTTSNGPAPLSRKALAASTSTRPTSSLSRQSSSSSIRPRPNPLVSNTLRKASSSSLRSAPHSSTSTAQKAQAEEAKRLRELRQEEERKLGAFGVTDEGIDDLLEGMDLGQAGFGFGDDGEEFKLDLDSE